MLKNTQKNTSSQFACPQNDSYVLNNAIFTTTTTFWDQKLKIISEFSSCRKIHYSHLYKYLQ